MILAAAEWVGLVVFFLIWGIVNLFSKKAEETPQRPLPTPRRPGSRPPQQPSYGAPPPVPRSQRTAGAPEEQIRNFLEELQRRVNKPQQPVPPEPEIEVEEEEVEEWVLPPPQAFPEEAPLARQDNASAYALAIAGPRKPVQLALDRNSVRKAFVMREVLGPPRALHPY